MKKQKRMIMMRAAAMAAAAILTLSSPAGVCSVTFAGSAVNRTETAETAGETESSAETETAAETETQPQTEEAETPAEADPEPDEKETVPETVRETAAGEMPESTAAAAEETAGKGAETPDPAASETQKETAGSASRETEAAETRSGKTQPGETEAAETQPGETLPAESQLLPAETEAPSLEREHPMMKAVPAPDYRTSARIDRTQWVGFGDVGDGSTGRYHVTFTDQAGNRIDQDAYCVEPRFPGPDGTFSSVGVKEYRDSKALAKIVYYGTPAMSGDDCFFAQRGNTGYTENEQYGIIHWAAAKIYGSDDWTYCTNSKGRAAVNALISYVESMPAIPDAQISFRKTELKASVPDGADYQQTPENVFLADEGNSITIKLPKYVTYHNADTGESSAESNGSTQVTIDAGTRFYFTAPLSRAGAMDKEWTVKVKGKYTKDLQAYLLDAGTAPSGDHYQPVICVESFTGDREASFTVEWTATLSIVISKAVSDDNKAYAEMVKNNTLYSLQGTQYAVYAREADAAGDKNRLAVLTCRENGSTPETELGTEYIGKTVYVKEIKAGKGYQRSDKVLSVKLKAGTNTVKAEDVPLYAVIEIEKYDAASPDGAPPEGMDLSGALFRLDHYKAVYGTWQEAQAGTASGSWTIQTMPEDAGGRTHYKAKSDPTHRTDSSAVYEINGQYVVPLGTLAVTETAGNRDYGTEGMYFRFNGNTVPGTGIAVNLQEKENADGTKSVEAVSAGARLTAAVINLEAFEQPNYGELGIKKAAAGSGAPLAGAAFRLTQNGNTVVPTAANGIRGDIDASGTITTGADGSARVMHLPKGSYKLTEIRSPKGYRADYRTIDLEIKGGKNQHTENNTPFFVPVSLLKLDADSGKPEMQGDSPLEGAVFDILAAEDIDNQDGFRFRKGETVVDSLTVGADGTAKTADNALTEGSYILRERTAPFGRFTTEDIPFEVRKTDADKVIPLTVPEDIFRGGVKIGKIDRETGKNAPLGGASLAGAVFEIINRSKASVYIDADGDGKKEKEIKPEDAVMTIITGEDGTAQTDERVLPCGTYEIRETAAPEGYLSPEEYPSSGYTRTFSITEDGQMADFSGEEAVQEQVIRNDITLRKIRAGSQKGMAKVPFRITSLTTGESHIVMTDANGRYSSAKVKHSVKTNAGDKTNGDPAAGLWFGTDADGNSVPVDDNAGALPYDTYHIEELPCSANEGMKMWEDVFTIEDDRVWQGAVIVDLSSIENEGGPVIGTQAQAGNGGQYAAADGTVRLTDTVTYARLEEGKQYVLVTTLVDKGSGEAVTDPEGNAVSARKLFKAATSFGTVRTAVTLDASGLAGKDVVFFEEVYEADENGGIPEDAEPAAEHKDQEDGDQTIHFCSIGTQAVNPDAGVNIICAVQNAKITDTVTYRNLQPGEKYRLSAVLMDKKTEEAVKGKEQAVTAEKTFVPNGPDGTAAVTFTFDASEYAGHDLVVFETLTKDGTVLAVHEDIEDPAQTLHVPEIETHAYEAETAEQVTIFREEMQVADEVTYKNLIPGLEYTFDGVLMDQETGEPLTDDAGEPVTAQAVHTPQEPDGSVVLVFTFKNVKLKGRRIAAFETVSIIGSPVAVHADLQDESQTVWFPAIRTSAADGNNGTHTLSKGEAAVITDTVTYDHLQPGERYVIKGVLMSRDTGEPVTENEEPVSAEEAFTAEAESGSRELTFAFSIAGRTDSGYVVFEELYHITEDNGEGTLAAEHKEIDDPAQTVSVSDMYTDARDAVTGLHEGNASEKTVTVTDSVSYIGLTPGREYTIKGTLMKKADGTPLTLADGTPVTAEKTFTPQSSSGACGLTFSFPAELVRGETVVVFEKMFTGEIEVAAHEDITDAGQSVSYPEIRTAAKDKRSGGSNMLAEEHAAVTDTVTYRNLTPGEEYTVRGRLMNAADGKPLLINEKEVTAQAAFTPETADGSITLEFGLDASALAGTTIVVFEELYGGEVKLGSHEDISDTAQSVYIPEIRTTAKDAVSGNHAGVRKEELRIIDTVAYTNLIPGREYTLSGVIMNKENAESMKRENGEEIRASVTFVPEASFGETQLEFVFKETELNTTAVVVFEEMILENSTVAVHADPGDEDQTVTYPEKEEPETETAAETTAEESTGEGKETTAAETKKDGDKKNGSGGGGGNDTNRTSPKTGDDADLLFWLLLLGAAGTLTAVLAALSHRKR